MAEERAEAPAGVATGSETALGRKTSADNGHNRMKQFQLDRINKIAPYEVKAEGKQYVFDTAQGLLTGRPPVRSERI